MKNKLAALPWQEALQFGAVYLGLAFINLRAKLVVTPAWNDGTLERMHFLLLKFQYANNEQSRLLQFYIPEAFRQFLGLSIPHAYLLQRWLFVFLAFLCFHFYLKKWFERGLAFAGVLLLAAIMPLAYFNHLQESAPFLLLTFLLVLWAIREERPLPYTALLALGALNNETILILPSVFFFYNLRRFELRQLLTLGLQTLATALPAFAIAAALRYLTRDRPHLGGVWHWPDNLSGILNSLQAFPLDYWKTFDLYIFFVFGVLWVYAALNYFKKPLFLQRAALMVPLFILAHLITGKITEVRQMLPLSFVVLPLALGYLFPTGSAVQPAGELQPRRPLYLALTAGALGSLLLFVGARSLANYQAAQLSKEPLQGAIALLQAQATPSDGLVCREIEVCGRISAYVPSLDTYWLPGPNTGQADQFWHFASEHALLWLVEPYREGSGHDLTVERWLSEQYGKVSQEWVDGPRVSRFVSAGVPDIQPTQVTFGDQIRLTGYAYHLEGRYLSVAFVRERAAAVDGPYKLFVHLVNAAGELLTQNDQFPVGDFLPPDTWTPNSSIRDLHGLLLPPQAAAPYRLRLGWYDSNTSQRLIIQSPPNLRGEEFMWIDLDTGR